MNRVDGPRADADSPEHAAGLVHVPYEQLSAAGLEMSTLRTRTVERQQAQSALSPDAAEAASARAARTTSRSDRAC